MQSIALQTELFVHCNLIEQCKLGSVDVAIGNDGQGDDSGRSLGAVLGIVTHLIFPNQAGEG